ncbi:hypothetical protein RvY_15371 [Ramazzottius varieornatus]|uniref:Uncharacterized protein n=1 Tax=Ramazzottius varieornatus TaxID=947166 RepID=A0A1D1VY03_RAMVA|nr:hypothetical protein RvY_15371 [Ramazzottius varieornatus]
MSDKPFLPTLPTVVQDENLKRERLANEFEYVAVFQRFVIFSLFLAAPFLLLLSIIAWVKFDEAVEWFIAGTSFTLGAMSAATVGMLSLRMRTNMLYRLLQLISIAMIWILLPGNAYAMLLLAQVIRETNVKLSQRSWTVEEKADEMALQSLRHVIVFAYGVLIVLQTTGAFLTCALLARFPYLWSTPTWKRDSMLSTWNIVVHRPTEKKVVVLK